MAPMLVAPAIIRHMFLDFSALEMVRLISLQLFGILGIVVISRTVFPKLLSFMLQAKGSVSVSFSGSSPHRAEDDEPVTEEAHHDDQTHHLFKRIVNEPQHANHTVLQTAHHTPDAALFAVVSW